MINIRRKIVQEVDFLVSYKLVEGNIISDIVIFIPVSFQITFQDMQP